MSQNEDHDDLQPTQTEGYKIAQKKTPEELAKLDAEDESLNRWKASLGIGQGGAAMVAPATGPKVTVLTLFLTSPTLPQGKRVELNVNNPLQLAETKKNPINIKEGVEYNVGIVFKVNHSIISGVRYIHIVKRAGVKGTFIWQAGFVSSNPDSLTQVDKHEQMLGSYGPSPTGQPYIKNFDPEESPSGLLARSGSYAVKSRIVDDDGEVYADFEWFFKLAKEW